MHKYVKNSLFLYIDYNENAQVHKKQPQLNKLHKLFLLYLNVEKLGQYFY